MAFNLYACSKFAHCVCLKLLLPFFLYFAIRIWCVIFQFTWSFRRLYVVNENMYLSECRMCRRFYCIDDSASFHMYCCANVVAFQMKIDKHNMFAFVCVHQVSNCQCIVISCVYDWKFCLYLFSAQNIWNVNGWKLRTIRVQLHAHWMGYFDILLR